MHSLQLVVMMVEVLHGMLVRWFALLAREREG